jgi:hypothetical protein
MLYVAHVWGILTVVDESIVFQLELGRVALYGINTSDHCTSFEASRTIKQTLLATQVWDFLT